MDVLSEQARFFLTLFAIANPLVAVPIFPPLTEGCSTIEKRRIARTTAVSSAVIMFTSFLAGGAILRFFGVSIASFRVAGGLLILLMALSMLQAKMSRAKQTRSEAEEALEKEQIAVVPLAMPILTGPGTVSTLIIAAHEWDGSWLAGALTGLSILVVSFSIWCGLRLATPISNALGKTGVNVVTRLMGLFLAAIAVEFITNGLLAKFPALAPPAP